MSRKYKFDDPDVPYFVSFATVGWIDLFIRQEYNMVVIDSLKYCQKEKGLQMYSWCIMTSHIHLITSSDDMPLEDIMRDLKSFTSRKLKEELLNHRQESRKEWLTNKLANADDSSGKGSGWQLWQRHNQPIALDSNTKIEQMVHYLHENPVAAGFVDEPQHW